MRILFEGTKYDKSLLEDLFEDTTFYHQKKGTLIKVGYYYSYKKNQIVYILPKVFLKDSTNTIFEDKSIQDLSSTDLNISLKHDNVYKWARQTSIYFYNSLIEFKNRNSDTNLIDHSDAHNLISNLGDKEYSYQELVLSFVNFYRKNKTTILYKHIEFVSNQAKKTNWEKTIQKSLPLLTSKKEPVYTTFRNRKKIINTEEELITLFFSILNHLNEELPLNLKIDKSYSIIKGTKFEVLKRSGHSKLRKIKYKYFNDTLKKMYHLCEMYFKISNVGNLKKTDEFIAVTNYEIVFEDMVDKLLTDETYEYTDEPGKKIPINSLRKNKDGKIIDHLYSERSLIDTTNIFAIGDSKYYKSSTEAKGESRFKQFTYAKNIIQQNLNLFYEKDKDNKNKEKSIKKIRYRDKETEGYDITPNFFIYGYINNYEDFETDYVTLRDDIVESYHWEHRLFDRDTLFIHQYDINFLYVLKSYTEASNSKINSFRIATKKVFRDNILKYFNDSEFNVYEYDKEDAVDFVNKHFKILNGKSIITSEGKLLIAKHNDDIKAEDHTSVHISDLVKGLSKFVWLKTSEHSKTLSTEEEGFGIAAEPKQEYSN